VRVRDYLVWLTGQAEARYHAGVPAFDAALDIAAQLGDYAELIDAERLAVNVDTLYRDFDPDRPRRKPVELFAEMARFRRQLEI